MSRGATVVWCNAQRTITASMSSAWFVTGVVGNIVWLFDGAILALGRETPYRMTREHECTRCGDVGHNTRTCKEAL